MPRPVYLVCSVSGALDAYTNSVNCFGLIETAICTEIPSGVGAPLSMRVVAAWLREDNETPDDVYEAEFTATHPGGPGEKAFAHFDNVKIATRVHRLVTPELRIASYFGPGVLVIACRIRRIGATEWTRMEYPILIEAGMPAPTPDTAVLAGDSAKAVDTASVTKQP